LLAATRQLVVPDADGGPAGDDGADLVETVDPGEVGAPELEHARSGPDATGHRPEEPGRGLGGPGDVDRLAVRVGAVDEAQFEAGLAVRAEELVGVGRGRVLVDAAADLVEDAGDPLLQGLEDRTLGQGQQGRAAATHRSGVGGVRSDHGYRRRCAVARQGQRAADVAGEHRAGDAHLATERPLGRFVDRLLRLVGRSPHGIGALDEHEHVADERVDRRLVHPSGLDRLLQGRAVHARRARHLDRQAAVGRADGLVGAVPVGDDEAVEAPLPAQDLVEEPVVGGAEVATELVVRRHDPPGAGLTDGRLEGAEVQLAQHPFVDDHVDGVALDLGVVGGEVLHGDGDAVGLDGSDGGRPEGGGELGILGEVLEGAPADRGAVEVDRRRQQHVGRLPARFLPEQVADPADQFGIPRRALHDAHRHDHRRRAIVGGELAPHPVGPVRHLDLGDAEPLDRMCPPARGAAEQAALLLQRELGEPGVGAVGHVESLAESSGQRSHGGIGAAPQRRGRLDALLVVTHQRGRPPGS
jgi:hypothetical protein